MLVSILSSCVKKSSLVDGDKQLVMSCKRNIIAASDYYFVIDSSADYCPN